MFGAPIRTGLTLTKVLGGISKTLGIANQVIPLYREAKPMIKNAKTIMSVLRDLNKPINNKPSKKDKVELQKKETFSSNTKFNNINSPSFFL